MPMSTLQPKLSHSVKAVYKAISGHVYLGGLGLGNITVQLAYAPPDDDLVEEDSSGEILLEDGGHLTQNLSETVTDGNGYFEFSNVLNGTYILQPIKPIYSFAPETRTVVVADDAHPGQDFIATALPNSLISGYVKLGGLGQPGVTVSLSGSDTDSVETDINGYYEFSVAIGSYTITPSLLHYSFTPSHIDQEVLVMGGNYPLADIVSELDNSLIYGHITLSGSGQNLVSVTLSGDDSQVTYTNSSGYYEFSVPLGSYTITPTLIGYDYTPAYRDIDITTFGSYQNDFTAALAFYRISGFVMNGVVGVPDILVRIAGDVTSFINTDENGFYFFDVHNGDYTISPEDLTGAWEFDPLYQTVEVNNANEPLSDFEATALLYKISGHINLNGSGQPGVNLTLTDSELNVVSTSTDLNGYYEFLGLRNGTYTIEPSLTGYTFNPVSQIILISGTDMVQDFASTELDSLIWGYVDLNSSGRDYSPNHQDLVISSYSDNELDDFETVEENNSLPLGLTNGTVYSIITDKKKKVRVHLTGFETDSVLADEDGYYEFSAPRGSYTITPVTEPMGVYIGGDFNKVLMDNSPRIQRINSLTGVSSPIPNLLDGFTGGEVLCMVKSGSYLYCGGRFTAYKGTQCYGLAKIDITTGSYVTAFDVAGGFANIDVRCLTLSTDGLSLYCGGYFGSYKGTAAHAICKLDSTTAALDATFDTTIGCGGSSPVVTHILLDGSSLYLTGSFTSFNGTTRQRLCKIDASTAALDGTFDTSSGFGAPCYMSLLDGLGNIFTCGTFTDYQGNARNSVAKLNAATAALDMAFDTSSGFSARVRQLAIDESGLYCAGDFTLYKGVTRQYIAKVNPTTAALDLTFDSTFGFSGGNGYITRIILDGNNLYCCGGLTSYKGVSRERVSKLNATTAALDMTFDSSVGCNDDCYDMVLDGSDLYIGGYFTLYGGITRTNLLKLNKFDYSLDEDFNTGFGPNGPVRCMVLDNSTGLYIGGSFTSYNSTERNRVAKINKDTGVLGTFLNGLSGADNTIYCIERNELIDITYVGGAFLNFNGSSCPYLTGLNSSGLPTVGPSPSFPCNGVVYSIKQHPYYYNKFYLGGNFTQIGSFTRNYIAIFNISSGTPDSAFNTATGFNGPVYGIELDIPSDNVYAIGAFTSYKGSTKQYVAKLNATDASLITAFDSTAGFNNVVAPAALLLNNGYLYCTNSFTSYNGTTRQRIAKLDSNTAVLDSTFDTSSGYDGSVTSLYKDNANLVCAGAFTSFKNIPSLSANKISMVTGNLIY